MQFFGSLRGVIFYSMTPPSSYAKTMPHQPMQCQSEAFLNHLRSATPYCNIASFSKNILFFSILISEFQFHPKSLDFDGKID